MKIRKIKLCIKKRLVSPKKKIRDAHRQRMIADKKKKEEAATADAATAEAETGVENIEEMVSSVQEQFEKIKGYTYTHLFIDNSSSDGSINKLREINENFNYLSIDNNITCCA